MSEEQGVEQWLTYAELGRALGVSVEAARSLARRHRWPRRIPNEYGATTRVLVPADRLRPGVDRLPEQSIVPSSTVGDTGSIGDRQEDARGPTDMGVVSTDTLVDPEVDTNALLSMFSTTQAILEEMRLELTASRARADVLQAALDSKEAEHQKRVTIERERADAERERAMQLLEELSEQRRITAMLVEQLARRRSWWQWRR